MTPVRVVRIRVYRGAVDGTVVPALAFKTPSATVCLPMLAPLRVSVRTPEAFEELSGYENERALVSFAILRLNELLTDEASAKADWLLGWARESRYLVEQLNGDDFTDEEGT